MVEFSLDGTKLTVSPGDTTAVKEFPAYSDKVRSVVFEEGITSIDFNSPTPLYMVNAMTLPKSCKVVTNIKQVNHIGQLQCSSYVHGLYPLFNKTIVPMYQWHEESTFKLDGDTLIVHSDTAKITPIIPHRYFRVNRVVITGSYKLVAKNLLHHCPNVRVVELQAPITAILPGTFQATKISKVTLPDTLMVIGAMSFYDCRELREINFPKSLNQIGQYAFAGCVNLIEVELPSSIRIVGDGCFKRCSELRYVKWAACTKSIPSEAFCNCDELRNVEISDTVTSIRTLAFYNCHNLAGIPVTSHCTSYGYEAFKNCHSITSIVVPEGMTSFNGNAFSSLLSVKSITLPSTIKRVNCDFANVFPRLVELIAPIHAERYKALKDASVCIKYYTTSLTLEDKLKKYASHPLVAYILKKRIFEPIALIPLLESLSSDIPEIKELTTNEDLHC